MLVQNTFEKWVRCLKTISKRKIVAFSRGYSFQKSVMTLVLVINIIVYI